MTTISETSAPILYGSENDATNDKETTAGERLDETGEKWVQAAEQVCQWIPRGLSYLVNIKDEQEIEGDYTFQFNFY